MNKEQYKALRRTAWHKRKVRNCMELTPYMARQCMTDIGHIPSLAEYITWAGLKITATAKLIARRSINRMRKEDEKW